MSRRSASARPLPAGSPAPTAPNDRRRLHGSIAHDLAVAILTGTYPPGSALPPEDTFSEQLQVSRTAYREAVRILSAKGLVESRPKTGTRITDRARWNMIDPDVLAWHLELEPTQPYLDSLFELRLMLEPRAAALAAERRTEADLGHMRDALERMERFTLAVAEGEQADLDFPHAIILSAGNVPLASLSPTIAATIRWSNRFKLYRAGGHQRDPVPDHRRVYEAIAAQDGVEAQARMDHLVRHAQIVLRRR